MTAIPPPRQAGPDQQSAEDTSSWRGTINGWVKDQKIRRDALIVLGMALIAVGMVLTAAIIIVWIIFHFEGNALAPVLSTTIGRIIAGSTVVTIAGAGGGALLLRRRRHRRPATTGERSTHDYDRSAGNTNQDSSEEKGLAESSAA